MLAKISADPLQDIAIVAWMSPATVGPYPQRFWAVMLR